ncbi:AAA family ATPase [Vibrio sp. D431a]|uniref:AAA family ATPase n=1 Tax=Vibrio sp. D431a TaxID=2837388 RepID=UPI002557215A|nr:AAA family ATPase [Vibrio sp. D431a]MDK9790099.1 AAA family ATPase [Vibrio sp. D431a]
MLLSYRNKPDIDDFISKYGNEHPLLSQFEETEQDKVFHGEGNVKIHVSYVLAELYKLLDGEFAHLSERDKEVLMFAAAYHDYAKPITTRLDFRSERECVVSPRHEEVGASRLLLSHRPEELTSSEWLLVNKLIANHQMPKRAISNNYSMGSTLRLLVDSGDLGLLYVLSLADFKGRVAPDMDKHIEYLELFQLEIDFHSLRGRSHDVLSKMRCELADESLIGLGRYTRNGTYNDDCIFNQIVAAMYKDRILSPSEGLSLPFNYENKSKVIVLCGLSGAGKSTSLVNYAVKLQAEIISLDLIREEVTGKHYSQAKEGEVRKIATDRLRECLRVGKNVVWDATSLRTDFRTAVTGLARGYGAYTEIVCLMTPVKECIRRDAMRLNPVGEAVIMKQFEKFQIPTAKEADLVVFE